MSIQWNLYGPSYGGRLALVAMRDAPEGIRSAIVAAPIPPPNVAWWASHPASVFDVVHRLSTACAGQPACDRAFPNVEQTLWRNVEAFDREPWTLQLALPNGSRQTLKVTGTMATALALNGLPIRAGLVTFPMRLHAMRARDETLVNALFAATIPSQDADDNAAAQAMGYAVQCFEEAPLNTPGLYENARRSYPPVLVDGGPFADASLCEHLHPFRASSAQLGEVRSEIPTLIVTGEFDPVAHRSHGPTIQRSLPKSQLAEIRDATHNGGGHRDYECTRRMTRDFLNAPMQKLDMSCLQVIPPLQFVADVKAIAR
jgi:pimeloyl-ACP methyl ester carboxylesterase